MVNQADHLVNLMKNEQEQSNMQARTTVSNINSRVITVTSGKGGVGKTNFAVNLALSFQKRGLKVVILDADFGLANIDVLMGIVPKYNLTHVFNGEKTFADVVSTGPMGIQFISGGSGLRELANISGDQLNHLMEGFLYLDTISDVILIDTGAGISDSVINFIKASNETIVITTPEPTSITDAYAVIKNSMITESGVQPTYQVVINRTDEPREGSEVFEKLAKVSGRFLSVKLDYLGDIPYDHNLTKAVKRQEPVVISYPNSDAAKAIDNICAKLLNTKQESNTSGDGMKTFMKRLINIFNK